MQQQCLRDLFARAFRQPTLGVTASYVYNVNMETLTQWCEYLNEQARETRPERYIVGVSGIPGSGKSTLAHLIVDTLNLSQPGLAVALPLDGFHLPNDVLKERGLLSRKGSPSTFDFEQFSETLARARRWDEDFAFPVYDRVLHEPVIHRSNRIEPGIRIVVTEGNYLLLDQSPWREISPLLDCSIGLDTSIEQAHRWLISRHTSGGRDLVSAEQHYQTTDFPNSRLVLDCSIQPHHRVSWKELDP